MLAGEGKIVVDFFGDGSSNQGTLMECLNIAALWQLPLVFVCENNTFSEFSPAKTVTAGVIADRARAFGIPTEVVDGNDVTAVAKAAKTAVSARAAGGGPSFIEAHTYRIQGHLEAEDLFLGGQRYREPEEIESWKKKGPIEVTRKQLEAGGTGGSCAAGRDRKASDGQGRGGRALRRGEPAGPIRSWHSHSCSMDRDRKGSN